MGVENKGKMPANTLNPEEIIKNWVQGQEDVRLFALCGKSEEEAGFAQDQPVYTFFLGVEDPEAFADHDWGKIFGQEPIQDSVCLWNPILIRLLLADRTRIDLSIDDPQVIAQIVMEAENPEIILDQDDLCCSMTLPTNFTRRESAPDVAELELYSGGFFRLMTDTAFYIYQGQLLSAQKTLGEGRAILCKMVEAAMERKMDYSVSLRGHAEKLDKYLDDEWYDHLTETYVDCAPERLWDGLFQASILFRKAGLVMDEDSSFTYPRRMDVTLMRLFRQMWEESQ